MLLKKKVQVIQSGGSYETKVQGEVVRYIGLQQQREREGGEQQFFFLQMKVVQMKEGGQWVLPGSQLLTAGGGKYAGP